MVMKMRLSGPSLALGLSLSVFALGATAAPVALADETPRTYGFKAGYWIPGEKLFRDVLGSGPSLGAAYSLPLRSNRWIDFEVLYWRASGDLAPRADTDGTLTTASSDLTLVPLALSLRADALPMRGIQPFILGGIDLNVVKEEVDFRRTGTAVRAEGGVNSISNAFFGVHVGGGAQYEISPRTSLHLEARLSIVNADTKGVGGVVGNGVSLGGFGIFAGVRIK
jgi:opacity protein-like surface antigen